MTTYKDTRNGMLGADFSTKLSAWLALGCITARQVHEYLVNFEDGSTEIGKGAQGYGKGENKGTGWVRFELVWRDYFRYVSCEYRDLGLCKVPRADPNSTFVKEENNQ